MTGQPPAALPVFLAATGPLHPADAVVALLRLPDGRYVMQLRDALPHIFFPDHWGCFGGAIDAGETPVQALVRELHEELELDIDAGLPRWFTCFDYDLACVGRGRISRHYYEVALSAEAFGRAVLHEGAAVQAFHADDLLQQLRVSPYDSFALWLHSRQQRLHPGFVAPLE